MRFAYLCCDFGIPIFGMGGSSVHLQEITNSLRRLGHEVKVFAPSLGATSQDARWEDSHHVPLGGFGDEVARLVTQEDLGQASHLANEFRALLYSEYAQKALLPIFAGFHPDVIYERYSLFSYAGVELARRLGVPLMLEVNAPLSQEQAKYRQLVLRHSAEELEGEILNCADALIVVSRALAGYAQGRGVPPGRITVVPNGVNPEEFHPAVSGKEVRSQYNLDGKFVVGFVGSLKPWHDLDAVLTAVRLLVDTDSRVHLLIVGQGPRMDQLRGQGEGYITCTGAVEHNQVPRLMAAMDVVVVPYSQGGDAYFSPLKLFEAMAMAKPVVGACIGQVAETIVHGDTGLLYEPGDGRDLASKIQQVLEMEDRGNNLGLAARRWVLANRTWEKNAGRIAAVAQSLIGMPKAS